MIERSQEKVGDQVWLLVKVRKSRLSPKLQDKWQGPYRVVRKYSEVVYEVVRPKSKSLLVHFNRLKPYGGRTKLKFLSSNESSSGNGDYLDKNLNHHEVHVGSWWTPHLISVNTESSKEDDTEDRSPDYGGHSSDTREAGSEPGGPGSKDSSHGYVPS